MLASTLSCAVITLGDSLVFCVRKFLLVSLALCSAMFVVPFSASAELLCVNVDPCGIDLLQGTPENTIGDALEAAALSLIAKGSLKIRLFITLTDGAQNKTTKGAIYTAKAGKTGSAKK